LLCVQSELSIGMPAAHHKYKIQNCIVVWGEEETIKHR